MTPRVLTLLLPATLALSACGADPAAMAQPEAPRLRTQVVYAGREAGESTWDGVVEAVQRADLSAQTAGRVTMVSFDIDDYVARGDVLLRITAFEQQAGTNAARAQLRAAEASATEAEGNYRRFGSLASQQYVSRAQLDQARVARDSAIAARDAARARLAEAAQQSEYTVVRSPFAGIVSARSVEPGETVAPGQPLMSVYAPGALRIEVQVPQSDAKAIRATARAQVVLGDGRRVDAAKVIVFPAADAGTHSVGVRVLLPDMKDAPQPGTTARVAFPIATDAQAMRVPASMVVQRGEVSGVYVLADNRIALRQVRVGRRIGDQVEVLAGLKPGDRIATDPVAALQAVAARRGASGE
jgi:RND family efflux transporter MFP subunit